MAIKKKSHRLLQKEATRKILLQSAYSLFVEKGYEKTTMRALAENAGVGLGTIFKHFSDKPSILAAAFEEDLNAVLQNAFRTLPSLGITSQLIHISNHLYSFYAKNPIFSRALIKEVLFLEGDHGKVLHQQLQIFLDTITNLIGNAVQNGELSPDTQTSDGATAYWSFYFTGLLLGLMEPSFNVSTQLALVERLIDKHFFEKGDSFRGC